MSKPGNLSQLRWQVQDLREQVILAEAEQVKIERHVREVVRHPVNRGGMRWSAPAPLYTDPSDALGALRGMRRLTKLVRPGMQNRISPDVLIGRWEAAANEAAILRSRLEELERALEDAGLRP